MQQSPAPVPSNRDHARALGDLAAAANVEIAYTPTYSSWLNRTEAQFPALRYFALDGTDHRNLASISRLYIIWRNNRIQDQNLKPIEDLPNVA